MFTFIVGVVVGAAIGWNFPQPEWARNLQSKITSYFKK
jgi:hypothetical protein